MMRPYWIRTDPQMGLGVGVTAHSEEDAEDMRNIDQNHVAPNMEDWLRRGIWYPRGYTYIST